MQSSNATNCLVAQGRMSIIAHKGDNVDFLIESLRVAIEGAMKKTLDDSLSDQVAFLAYLGENGNFGSTAKENGDDRNLAVVLGVGIPLLLALLLFSMSRPKAKQRDMTARDYHVMMTSDFVLIGTGDPPESHHEGSYHQHPNGSQYLSTRCEACFETRRKALLDLLGGLPPPEIDGSDQAGESSKWSGVDVHNCTSTTCLQCRNNGYDLPMFLPSTLAYPRTHYSNRAVKGALGDALASVTSSSSCETSLAGANIDIESEDASVERFEMMYSVEGGILQQRSTKT
jgi:hypothetical protein